jgi:D-alanyl-D-alanine carboxypeptidase
MKRVRLALAALLIGAAWVTAGLATDGGDGERSADPVSAGPFSAVTPDAGTAAVVRPNPLAVRLPVDGPPLELELGDPPRAGLLFDVETGEVLWARGPRRRAPIASLTKMMTALVVAARHRPRERVLITPEATAYTGSGIGLLREGERVPLEALLHGLMLVSGNDAAIALAQHDSGGQDAFVDRMNARAGALGLTCSRFSSPSGIRDRGNWSCPLDLATLARMVLADPWLRRIVATRRARFRVPVRGRVLDLFNINPFIARGDRGVTGVKTGLTSAAGRCYVITARVGNRHLGVVLLDTPDPLRQVPRLLRAGAAASS